MCTQREVHSHGSLLLFACIELREHCAQSGFDATFPHVGHETFLSSTASMSPFPLIDNRSPFTCPERTAARRKVDTISSDPRPPWIPDPGIDACAVDGSGEFIVIESPRSLTGHCGLVPQQPLETGRYIRYSTSRTRHIQESESRTRQKGT